MWFLGPSRGSPSVYSETEMLSGCLESFSNLKFLTKVQGFCFFFQFLLSSIFFFQLLNKVLDKEI